VKLVAAASAAVLLCAGCGGASRAPQTAPPPHLPRTLAQTWSREAQAVADALDAGDACVANRRAQQLRTEVIVAVNAERVPARFLEPLTSAVNALPERIVCTPPPAPVPAPTPKPPKRHKPPKPNPHDDHGHGHGKKHGHDEGGDG
jgi:hypothetical protein